MLGPEVIASLLLGGFPLVVEGLEHYRKAFQPLKDWWHFERTFVKFLNELEVEQARFDQNIEKLFDPFVASEPEMSKLLDDPTEVAWRDAGMEAKLKDRLGRSYGSYMSNVNEIHRLMEDLKQILGFQNGQANWIAPGDWDQELKRLKISFSKKKIKHLRQLAKYNDELRELIGPSDELTQGRRRRRARPYTRFLRIVQDQASSLYNVLKGGWRCNCPSPHIATLLLEKCTADDLPSSVSFRILFEPDSTSQPWHATEIRILDKPQPASELNPPLNPGNQTISLVKDQFLSRSHRASSSSSRPRGITKAKKLPVLRKKKVDIADPVPQLPHPIPSAPEPTQIEDLCLAIRQLRWESECLGFLYDNQSRRHGIHPIRGHPHSVGSWTTISLERLLSSHRYQNTNRSAGAVGVLTRAKRLALAATLASSFLQLQATPWLCETWSKRDILFFQASEGLQAPIIENPYVAEQFESSSASSSQVLGSQQVSSNDSCENSLFSLGVLLLELCFGETLEEQKNRKRFLDAHGKPNALTDFCTAKEWLKKVREEHGDGLADAIRRCINGAFGARPDFNDDEFRQEVYSCVVQPLEDHLRLWNGTPARM